MYKNTSSFLLRSSDVKNKSFSLNIIFKIFLVSFLILALFLSLNSVFNSENHDDFDFSQGIIDLKNNHFKNSPFIVDSEIIGDNKVLNTSNENSHSKGVNTVHAASKVSPSSKAKLSSLGSPKTVSQKGVLKSSKNLKNYVSKNKKLPKYVTVEGYRYSVPEFTYLMTKTVEYQKKKVNSRVTVKYNVKNPTKPSGKTIKSKISLSNYYKYSLKTSNYINKYKKVPNYITTNKGSKIQYQTAIYMFSSILRYDYYYKKLPKSVNIKISSSNKINIFLIMLETLKQKVFLIKMLFGYKVGIFIMLI